MISKEEIEKAKEYIVGLINLFYEFPNPQSVLLEDNKVQYVETLLQYIEKLEQENKALKKGQTSLMSSRKKWKDRYYKEKGKFNKQNKIIDEIEEQLAGWAMFDSKLQKSIMLYTKEEVKQYFEEKVEESNV